MLSNLLRIFITKQTINKVQEEQQRLLAEQIELTNRMAQTTNKEDLDEYLKQAKQIEKNRVRYYSRPCMAEETAANARAFFPIFLLLFIAVMIGCIYLFVWEIFGERKLENFIIAIFMALFMYALLYIYMYIKNYLEKTMCLYYKDRICIKKYKKKDIVITYDEVKECIKEKKIKVHNGRFEYPFKDGKICIYTWGNAVTDGFYEFINKKCEVKMPKIEKKEKDVVRRTGIGWVCYFVMAIPFFALELFLLGIVVFGDYGLQHTTEEILRYIVELLFSVKESFVGLIGLGFVILGVILKFVFYFPAKKHFEDYKDIKVSLF